MDAALDLSLLILAGILGGFISGLLGVGGGLIFVPILDYFLIKQGVYGNDLVLYTLANSFLAILVSGLTGSYSAFKDKTINYPQLFTVSIAAIASILLTSYLIGIGNWYTPFIFKSLFCVMLAFTLIKTLLHIENIEQNNKLNLKICILIGLITGVVSGLSGLGGGIIMIPLFMMVGHLNIKKASTLSLAVIPVLAFPNVIFYALKSPEIALPGSTGYIAWKLVGPMILGVLFAVQIGVKVSKLLSASTIKFIFAAFIVLTVFKTLYSLITDEKKNHTSTCVNRFTPEFECSNAQS